MSPSFPPPTGLIQRFGLFVEGLKRAVAEGIGRDRDTLGPLSVVLWTYLGRTLRRLAALHARFEAGTLAERRCSTGPRPPSDNPGSDRPASDRPASERRRRARLMPPGAVLARYHAGHFYAALHQLVEDPEMRSLLAAAPQAGRLLRPLWRMLTADKLPEALRLPPRPRQPRQSPPPEPDGTEAAAPPHAPPRPRRALPAGAEWVSAFRLPPFSSA